MADNDILKQFQEFLEQKAASEKESADAEDFEVEIWNKDGAGVRTKRSHAKPFLQALGLDVDEPPKAGVSDADAGAADPKAKPKGKQAANTTSSVTAKYFTKAVPTK